MKGVGGGASIYGRLITTLSGVELMGEHTHTHTHIGHGCVNTPDDTEPVFYYTDWESDPGPVKVGFSHL